jgi:hypothetical protein
MTCTYMPMKMEQRKCSETSAYKIQTPRNYPEESIHQVVCLEVLRKMVRNHISTLGVSAGVVTGFLPNRIQKL